MIGQRHACIIANQLTGQDSYDYPSPPMMFQDNQHFILLKNPNSAMINPATGTVSPYTEAHEGPANSTERSNNASQVISMTAPEPQYQPESITPYNPFDMHSGGG